MFKGAAGGQKADDRQRPLLCSHRQRPRRRTFEPRDELPPFHLRLQRFVGKPIAIQDALEPVLAAAYAQALG
jgi:hypothetical protein